MDCHLQIAENSWNGTSSVRKLAVLDFGLLALTGCGVGLMVGLTGFGGGLPGIVLGSFASRRVPIRSLRVMLIATLALAVPTF
jgi:hypothetical protein